MKRFFPVFLVCLVLLSLFFASRVFMADSGANPAELNVAQFDWDGNAGIANSRVGEIQFTSFSAASMEMIKNNGGAYINVGFYNNVAPNREWIVRNFFIPANDVVFSLRTACIFGLSDSSINGIPWSGNYVDIMLTEAPVDYGTIMPGRTFQSIAITHEGYRIGGITSWNGVMSNLVYTLGPWTGASITPVTTPTSTTTTTPILITPSITTTTTSPTPSLGRITPTITRRITPTITRRAIKPTITTRAITPNPTVIFPTIIFPTIWPTPTPTPVDVGTIQPGGSVPAVDEPVCHCVPGSITRSIQYMLSLNCWPMGDTAQMEAELARLMNTNGDGTCGTYLGNALSGKAQYASDHGLPISSTFITGMAIQNVIDALNSGGDVEIWLNWATGGGHAAMIIAVVQYPDGSCDIYYVDDPNQGNGVAENQVHVIHVEPNGTFPGGSVWGFYIETFTGDNLCSPSPTPTPTNTPTPTPTRRPTPTSRPSSTPTPTIRVTVTPTSSPTPTVRITVTPTATPTPTIRNTVTPSETPTPTIMVTVTPTRRATVTPSVSITATPSRRVSPSPSVSVTALPTGRAASPAPTSAN
ncbi:MAG TPA: hypothetical protein VHY08_08415 [Bacillota bacterium]|nr:hypothetical protein [Bacillota bacterium]